MTCSTIKLVNLHIRYRDSDIPVQSFYNQERDHTWDDVDITLLLESELNTTDAPGFHFLLFGIINRTSEWKNRRQLAIANTRYIDCISGSSEWTSRRAVGLSIRSSCLKPMVGTQHCMRSIAWIVL